MAIGNDIFFGNVVRASIIALTYNLCVDAYNALGKNSVDLDSLTVVGVVRTIPVNTAPVTVLTTAAGPLLNLALGPNEGATAFYDCPVERIVIINQSGSIQTFANTTAVSRISSSDALGALPMAVDKAYIFVWRNNLWYPTCNAALPPP